MELQKILKRTKILESNFKNFDIDISNITCDSRQVEKGSLFVAVKGEKIDGHSFVDEVSEKGVSAVLCEVLPQKLKENVCYIIVDDTRQELSNVSCEFYDNPSEKLILTGVTGTNGKTTTATLLYKLFSALGFKSGLISTVENYVDTDVYPTANTTPGPLVINSLLAKMVEKGCQYCFMEVSSHSVVQKRIHGLKFSLGIFSNITLDHLDYHKTFQEYIKAKKGFFDSLDQDAFALVNGDDKNGMVMVQNSKAKVKTYGLKGFYDFNASILECGFEGMLLNICGKEMWSFLPGEFNAYNILAVYSAAVLLGQPVDEVLQTLSALHSVRGRFDIVNISKITAIVDYAHTPDALENVLNTIGEIRRESGKDNVLITVCGCGGDRDKSKRPLMAKIACRLSDKVVLTSDNPRTENPESILDDMYAGLENKDLAKAVRISDRKSAILSACMMAREGDIILIAGKGHETYQEINGVKHHFDDKETVSEILKGISKN